MKQRTEEAKSKVKGGPEGLQKEGQKSHPQERMGLIGHGYYFLMYILL